MAPDVPAFDELYEVAKAEALLASDELSEESFSDGYMMDIHAGMGALLAEEVIRQALEFHRATFFRTAEGERLDELADDHFMLARQAAAHAIGTVRFLRPSAAAGNVLIPVGTVVSTVDGTRFASTEEVLLTGLQIDSDVQALESGQAGIVNAATVTQIVGRLEQQFDTLGQLTGTVFVPGSPVTDSTVTVSNLERTAGGSDGETDAAFRARVRGYLATVRRGTPEALAFGAKTVGGVVEASVDEGVDPLVVYVADAAGGANTALVDAVRAELEHWRAAGIVVNVVGATVLFQDVDLTLTFEAGFDTSATRDKSIAAVLEAVNATGIGQTLYRAAIVAAAKVEGIRNVVVNDPAGDVVPDGNELLRTERERITLGA